MRPWNGREPTGRDRRTGSLGLREEAEAPDGDMGVIMGAEARSRVMGVGDSTQPGGEGKGEAQDLQHSGRPECVEEPSWSFSPGTRREGALCPP